MVVPCQKWGGEILAFLLTKSHLERGIVSKVENKFFHFNSNLPCQKWLGVGEDLLKYIVALSTIQNYCR